ncbi:hypothetical protein ACU6RQ_08965 [Zobellella denitrificans]|uniref:Uncharacterized protein n=1 Tax=Zobellella denitrificans TaxID=347534 RepID=A0A291HPC2_9GAMM|nr:hypothetical protein [Zobellella denitrificans]ATG73995.1 hypothetical protein AN401_09125 [Zobellella denitrificans]
MNLERYNGYAYEKIISAIQSLISNQENIKSALIDADTFNLCHITPDNDLPGELHELYEELEEQIQCLRDGTGDDYAAELAISKLLTLFGRLHRHENVVPY